MKRVRRELTEWSLEKRILNGNEFLFFFDDETREKFFTLIRRIGTNITGNSYAKTIVTFVQRDIQ